MSDSEDGREIRSGELIPASPRRNDTESNEHAQFRELMDVERARIESTNRRTDVVKSMVEAQLEQNRREYDFANKRLEQQEKSENRRISTFRSIVFVTIGFGILVSLFLLWMSFFGSPVNSAVARSWLTTGMQALGGGAVLTGAIKLAERFLRSR